MGLCAPCSQLTRPPEQRRESQQSWARAGSSLLLSSLLSPLAPTHPHLLVTYLRRSKAEAVCQGGNDISSGTAEKNFRQLLWNTEDVLQAHDAEPRTHGSRSPQWGVLERLLPAPISSPRRRAVSGRRKSSLESWKELHFSE